MPWTGPRATDGLLALTLLAATGVAGVDAQRFDADELDRWVEAELPAAFDRYRDFLRLPNDARNPADLEAVLAWVEDAFQARGFTTRRIETAGLPLVLAERLTAGADRTVLIYHHADGQPVDPARWDQASPWEPVLKERDDDGGWREIPWARLRGPRNPEWRVFARSAADSKGPIVQLLTALEVLDARGIPPAVNLKVIIDAEEELGSPNLPPAVARHAGDLRADALVILDGPPHASARPTLTFGARGIATFTLTTYGPLVPQHSGHYGNYAPNPASRLAHIMASMKDPAGRVIIAGWYDGITLDEDTRRILAAVPDDEPTIRAALGIAEPDAVAGSLQESLQYPSLNIRGLASAWVGDQVRTVIPATATAEVDIRLVVESDPHRLLELVRSHISALGYHVLDRAPTDAERRTHDRLVSFTSDIAYGAFRTPMDSDAGLWLRGAMRHRHGAEPILIRTSGGSVPIAPFVAALGLPAVMVPTVNPDNNQHSPNENLRVGSFVDGIATIATVLAREFPR